MKKVWIAWEKHRRTLELCRHFGIKDYLFDSDLPRVLKHPFFLIKTWLTLHKEKPRVLFVQNPSMLLTVFVCIIRKLYRYVLIVDAHNAGLSPVKRLGIDLSSIYGYVQRVTDITIVSNHALGAIVKFHGGNPFVLPDRIPEPCDLGVIKLKGNYNLVYISTFEKDEPYQEVLFAANELPSDVYIYVTGNFLKCDPSIQKKLSRNVILTGFLTDKEYWDLLFSATFIIDLTTREDCLLCGAYEAVAVEKPMILSDTVALRSYFSKGAVYTCNNRAEIVFAIKKAIENEKTLKSEIEHLKTELLRAWEVKSIELKKHIMTLAN